MQTSLVKLFTKTSFIAVAAITALASQASNAEPTGYNQISFSVNASQEVENDQVTASLYKRAQASTPKQLATELNTAMNEALKIAKRYPSITATTGTQNTYPQYDDNEKIVGWNGTATINLKSSDFTATSDLVAKLQNSLVMGDLNFGVSKQKQDAVEKALMTKASQEFQAQANSLATAWGANGYRILAVTLNTRGNFNNYPSPVMMSARMESGAPPSQKFEGGNTQIEVTADGSIELAK